MIFEKKIHLKLFFLLFAARSLFASYITSEEIELYYQQGYLLKKSALTSSELNEIDVKSQVLLERILSEIESENYPSLDVDQKIYIDGSQIVFTNNNGKIAIKRVVGCGSIEPAFHRVLCSDKMIDTFFNILGSNQIEQLICQFHAKLPGDGVSFVKHRDIRYRKQFDPDWEDVGGNGSYAVCILAIDPMSDRNGGLIIDKKSFPENSMNESEIVSVTMEPGDMLFMHPELLHWSEANTSLFSRRALLTGFCIYGANHRNYPGDCTNDVITKDEDEIEIEPAPWKKLGDTHF